MCVCNYMYVHVQLEGVLGVRAREVVRSQPVQRILVCDPVPVTMGPPLLQSCSAVVTLCAAARSPGCAFSSPPMGLASLVLRVTGDWEGSQEATTPPTAPNTWLLVPHARLLDASGEPGKAPSQRWRCCPKAGRLAWNNANTRSPEPRACHLG